MDLEGNYNRLPIELRAYLARYLDQAKLVDELRADMRTLLNRIETLRRTNHRLTLSNIQLQHDVRNLEFILANGLDEETRAVARELDFEELSDSDDETVYDFQADV